MTFILALARTDIVLSLFWLVPGSHFLYNRMMMAKQRDPDLACRQTGSYLDQLLITGVHTAYTRPLPLKGAKCVEVLPLGSRRVCVGLCHLTSSMANGRGLLGATSCFLLFSALKIQHL